MKFSPAGLAESLERSAGLFTILPVRADAAALGPGEGVGALLWLPAVGAALGAAAGVPAWLIRQWEPHANGLGAVLAVAVLVAATRCLHLDGLADTADGLGSRAPAEQALEIMRKSDIGPFGVIALVLVLLADVVAVSTITGDAWTPVAVLAVAAATGRVAAVQGAIKGVKPARESGFGALVADGVPDAGVVAWTIGVLAFGVIIALVTSIPIGWVIIPQVVALAVGWALRAHAGRRLGGVTGDVFGALIELTTAVVLLGVALWLWKHLVTDYTWPRPVPLVGDTTSAAARAARPDAWAFDEADIKSLHNIIEARRDIRRYRPDPVPDEILRHVLEAGHQAPSVGHSQPWRFIVVTGQAARDRAALLADRERLRQAGQLTPDRKARLLDLQLDGIREAPVGVVVACDRRAHAAGVLGRATFTEADMWSCACAVQNIWLAARAAGLGLGWVTLFQPADLKALLHLPDGVETLGWLCLGWPDERPPEPGLERRGWSARLPLGDVILSERWPAEGAPERPADHLAGPDQQAVVAGRDSGDDLLTVPGSLGILDVTVNRVLALSQAGPTGKTVPTTGTLVIAAADHPVTRHGVSAYPPHVTADVYEATLRGVSLGATTARQCGLRHEAVYARPAGPQGDLAETDALAGADVEALVRQGASLGERLARAGDLVCLGEVGIGNTTVAAALAGILLDLPPAEAVGLGAASDSAMMHRKEEVVRLAMGRARSAWGKRVTDPWTAAAAVGGPEIALLAGVTLGAARRGIPVVLDGLVTSVAALLAVRAEPAVQAALVAGQRSRERAHQAVLTELGLEPLLDLRLRSGEGVGACYAAQLLLAALRTRHQTARVTEEP
jgi:nicotinate-nucleotide--dimethylbenzimidazole phosphoribosyltransferase